MVASELHEQIDIALRSLPTMMWSAHRDVIHAVGDVAWSELESGGDEESTMRAMRIEARAQGLPPVVMWMIVRVVYEVVLWLWTKKS